MMPSDFCDADFFCSLAMEKQSWARDPAKQQGGWQCLTCKGSNCPPSPLSHAVLASGLVGDFKKIKSKAASKVLLSNVKS